MRARLSSEAERATTTSADEEPWHEVGCGWKESPTENSVERLAPALKNVIDREDDRYNDDRNPLGESITEVNELVVSSLQRSSVANGEKVEQQLRQG